MADIQRDESFRSAIKNQKRRLSATKIEKKNTLHAPDGVKAPPKIGLLGKGKGEKEGNFLLGRDYWTPPGSNRSTPVRALDGSSDLDTAPTTGSNPDIRLEFWDIAELSPLSTPATSPKHSPRNSPSPLKIKTPSRSPSPRNFSSPVPPDSPLLSVQPISPAVKRARSFNKDLRRARSFRALREKSCSRASSLANSRCVSPEPEEPVVNIPINKSQEVAFSIKRALRSRKGWKIMPEDGHSLDGEALRKVVNMIKDIEFQGFAVPERITIKI